MKKYLNQLANKGLLNKEDLEDRTRIVKVLISNIPEMQVDPKDVEESAEEIEESGLKFTKSVKKRKNKKERKSTWTVIRIFKRLVTFFRKLSTVWKKVAAYAASPSLALMDILESVVKWLNKVIDKLFGGIIRIFRYIGKYFRMWFTSPVKALIVTFLFGFAYWKASKFLEDIFTSVSGAVKDLVEPITDLGQPHHEKVNFESIATTHPEVINEDTITYSAKAKQLHIENRLSFPVHRKNMQALVENVVDPILDRFPTLEVSSGYRSPELQRALGRDNISQHSQGQAIDLKCGSGDYGMKLGLQVINWIYYSLPEYDQVILEQQSGVWWVHVSYVRNGTNRKQIKYCPNANSGSEVYYNIDFTEQAPRYINKSGVYQTFAMPE